MKLFKLYVVMGIPGSGKSTWSRNHLHAPIVSSDDIRVELKYGVDAVKDFKGSIPWNPDKNREVFNTFHMRINSELAYGSVIADATSLEKRAREQLFRIAEGNYAEVYGILFTNVLQAIERNSKREYPVPDAAMVVMREKYERAREQVLSEPFHSLTFVESVN